MAAQATPDGADARRRASDAFISSCDRIGASDTLIVPAEKSALFMSDLQ
jgi:hypothetical protein